MAVWATLFLRCSRTHTQDLNWFHSFLQKQERANRISASLHKPARAMEWFRKSFRIAIRSSVNGELGGQKLVPLLSHLVYIHFLHSNSPSQMYGNKTARSRQPFGTGRRASTGCMLDSSINSGKSGASYLTETAYSCKGKSSSSQNYEGLVKLMA